MKYNEHTAPVQKEVITIFGARGKTGIELIKYFSRSRIHCRAVTQDLKNAFFLPYVNWIEGELVDIASIRKLVDGSDRIFLNTAFSPKMEEMQKNIIWAAREAGVKYIVKLSYELLSEKVLQQVNSLWHVQHKQIEKTLKYSGINWTILRTTGYMQNWLPEFSVTVKSERKIYEASGDGKMAYIDARDVAEVAAMLLLSEPGLHDGKIYELTGNEPVNFSRVAYAISQAIGEKVSYIAETPKQAAARLTESGYPDWAVKILLAFATSQRHGQEIYRTTTAEKLLGRPPRDVHSFARDYINHFI